EILEPLAMIKAGTCGKWWTGSPPFGVRVPGRVIDTTEDRCACFERIDRPARADIDNATEGRTAVQYAACALDHFHLLDVLDREERPVRAPDVPAQYGHAVHQHHHTAACTIAETATGTDLRILVHDHHTRNLVQRLVQ